MIRERVVKFGQYCMPPTFFRLGVPAETFCVFHISGCKQAKMHLIYNISSLQQSKSFVQRLSFFKYKKKQVCSNSL